MEVKIHKINYKDYRDCEDGSVFFTAWIEKEGELVKDIPINCTDYEFDAINKHLLRLDTVEPYILSDTEDSEEENTNYES